MKKKIRIKEKQDRTKMIKEVQKLLVELTKTSEPFFITVSVDKEFKNLSAQFKKQLKSAPVKAPKGMTKKNVLSTSFGAHEPYLMLSARYALDRKMAEKGVDNLVNNNEKERAYI